MQVSIARQLGLQPTTVGNFFMNARRRLHDKWQQSDMNPDHHRIDHPECHHKLENNNDSTTSNSSSCSNMHNNIMIDHEYHVQAANHEEADLNSDGFTLESLAAMQNCDTTNLEVANNAASCVYSLTSL